MTNLYGQNKMQTTDYKQGTKCSVQTSSTDLLGTKSLDCDKKYSLKQLLVTNCEDAGFIFKHATIKVNNVMQPTKNRKEKIQCWATWFLVLCCMFYIDFSFSFFLFSTVCYLIIIIIIIIITYLTRVNPSAEAVIIGCPVFSVVIWNDSLTSNFLMVFYPHLQTIVNLAYVWVLYPLIRVLLRNTVEHLLFSVHQIVVSWYTIKSFSKISKEWKEKILLFLWLKE